MEVSEKYVCYKSVFEKLTIKSKSFYDSSLNFRSLPKDRNVVNLSLLSFQTLVSVFLRMK